MTKEDIIRMAQEADLPLPWISEKGVLRWSDLERFATLVAASEREACANVCEAQRSMLVARHPARVESDPDSVMAQRCAAAIRARGQS